MKKPVILLNAVDRIPDKTHLILEGFSSALREEPESPPFFNRGSSILLSLSPFMRQTAKGINGELKVGIGGGIVLLLDQRDNR